MNNPIAVICGASATGLGVGRDLGRRGVPVVFADFEPFRPGFASRFASREAGPLVAKSEADLVDQLINFAQRQTQTPVLFQTTDQLVLAVAKHRKRLETVFHIADSTRLGIADLVADKRAFYELCVKHGVAAPRTAFPETAEQALATVRRFDFPVILKPIHGHLWRERLKGKKLLVAESEPKFRDIIGRFSEDVGDLMIQEMIPGPEKNLWVGGLYLRQSDGEAGPVFVGRKLRQFPPGFGSASLADAKWNETVKDLSVRFLKDMGYRGVCGTEFKFDERDQTYKMVEVNPRQTLWFALIGAAGIPLNYYSYCDLAGLPLPTLEPQKDGTKWLLADKDFITATKYFFSGKLGLLSWMNSYRGIKVRPVWSWDDLRPSLSILRTYTHRIRSRFGRRS